jgi:Fe-S cluster assembly ATP-binding protein
MLNIKGIKAEIEGNEILNGLDLEVKPGEVHAIMGPNGAGKSTTAAVLTGREEYDVTGGSIEFNGKNLLDMAPEDRSREGIFLSFQYPIEIPGVTVTNFVKTCLAEHRKHQGLDPIKPQDFLKKMKETLALLNWDQKMISRSLNEGFSGGEKKRNEIFQMLMLDPKLAILDETDSGLDIDALRIVANGINKFRAEDKAVVLITHYQRLLDYIKPDFVHVLADGKIVKTGNASLAIELEEKGYDWLKEEMV